MSWKEGILGYLERAKTRRNEVYTVSYYHHIL